MKDQTIHRLAGNSFYASVGFSKWMIRVGRTGGQCSALSSHKCALREEATEQCADLLAQPRFVCMWKRWIQIERLVGTTSLGLMLSDAVAWGSIECLALNWQGICKHLLFHMVCVLFFVCSLTWQFSRPPMQEAGTVFCRTASIRSVTQYADSHSWLGQTSSKFYWTLHLILIHYVYIAYTDISLHVVILQLFRS